MSDPDWVQSLPALLDEVWQRLEACEGAARHPVLATAGDGGPEVRTVVLRSASREAAMLEIHTDAASQKVAQLRRRPRAALLVWEPAAALQTRIDARVSIRSGEAAAVIWANVPAKARLRYGGTPPGARIDTPDDAAQAADPGRFAVLHVHVHRIDVLHLGQSHRRALYLAENGFAGRWIAP